jgi:hypothetical protein
MLDRVAEDPNHPLAGALDAQLSLVDDKTLQAVMADARFRSFWRRLPDRELDRRARAWAVTQALSLEIPRRRLESLSNASGVQRPPPYDHPAVADLDISPDLLVPMAQFELEASVLIRNGHAFSVVPPVQSPNSQYWFVGMLMSKGLVAFTHVRLDPFLHGPSDEYPRMEYKMLWYGRPLDWERLRNLKEEEHGRWNPGPLSYKSEFTDFVWAPRGSEVHFQCEELPQCTDIVTRGSRYFHAVYRQDDTIEHFDGAVRIYTEPEWRRRRDVHLRHTGKIGKRVKILRVEGPVDRDAFATVCPSFFVWNNDLARYFGADLPEDF